MNSEKFELLSILLRSKEPATTAARLVLLNGLKNVKAAKIAGVLPQSVSRVVKSFRQLNEKIGKVYGDIEESTKH